MQKATDLDLHCLQMQRISGFSRTRVKIDKSRHILLVAGTMEKNDSFLNFHESVVEPHQNYLTEACYQK